MCRFSLALFFSLCVLINRGQSAKDDTLQLVVGLADPKIENVAAIHRIVSKLPGVQIKLYCANHSVFYMTAPVSKYKSAATLFDDLIQLFTSSPLYLKTGSSSAPPSDCETMSSGEEAKLIKLINEM